jgi:hypothetical protein
VQGQPLLAHPPKLGYRRPGLPAFGSPGDEWHIMSRFVELRRIESAIEKKDVRELGWALAYCESRLSISTMRQHQKHWQALIARVQAALAVARSTG